MVNRIMSEWLVATLVLATTQAVFAQVRVEPSERMNSEAETDSRNLSTDPTVTTTPSPPYWEIRADGGPITRDSTLRLFRLEFGTGIVLRATCQHIQYFDPCAELPSFLEETGVAQRLAERIRRRLEEKIENDRIIEELERSTLEKIRRVAREQRSRGIPGRYVLGSLMFAGGGFLSASRNEWPIDEGYIGVAIATVGLGLVLKPLIGKWRGTGVNASRTGLGVEW